MNFSLQGPVKNFLCVVRSHPRYLKGPPTSGLYNAPTLVVIRRQNPFLFEKQINPPPLAACFGNSFFIYSDSIRTNFAGDPQNSTFQASNRLSIPASNFFLVKDTPKRFPDSCRAWKNVLLTLLVGTRNAPTPQNIFDLEKKFWLEILKEFLRIE